MSANQGPRHIAIKVLLRREESKIPIDQVMEKMISASSMEDDRDRQLAMSIIYGVLRWQGFLDRIIAEFSSHPLAKIKQRTLQALRVGIFQLLFLDRVPASAAINETIQALKEMKQPKWLTGFVNGTLRSIDRQREELLSRIDEKNLHDAAVQSHPEWLVKRWKKRYSEDQTSSICLANNTIAPLFLRTNTALTTRANLLKELIKGEKVVALGKHSPLAVKVLGFQGPVKSLPGFAKGLFQVQDEAAQLVTMLLGDLQPGSTYLDGCAGLGGKTSHLAQMLPPESSLIAVEPSGFRVAKLRENLARLQLSQSVTIVEGAIETLLPDMKEKFAGILIDAPCSGLGVIRRHPDIRWNRIPDDLIRYQEMQLSILESAARLLLPGGILVYATCSTEPEENDEVVEKFLTENRGFLLSDCRDILSGNTASLADNAGFFRTLPGQDGLDGFFAARLIKQ
jgi:16S rRNA (cytosine967-C5)-methyltransferase